MSLIEMLNRNTVAWVIAYGDEQELLCQECRVKSIILQAVRVSEDDLNQIALERGHGRCDRCQQEIGSVPYARNAQV